MSSLRTSRLYYRHVYYLDQMTIYIFYDSLWDDLRVVGNCIFLPTRDIDEKMVKNQQFLTS
jgi:hypothetical protein